MHDPKPQIATDHERDCPGQASTAIGTLGVTRTQILWSEFLSILPTTRADATRSVNLNAELKQDAPNRTVEHPNKKPHRHTNRQGG